MVEIVEKASAPGEQRRYDLYVYWSIYVRVRDKGSLLRVHVPPIEAIITNPAIPFQFITEDYNQGQFRIIAYQNYPNALIKETIPVILATAYSLANNWNVGGLGCLATGEYSYVHGTWTMSKPSHRAPALENIMFEIERGVVRDVNEDGGVWIDRPGDVDGLEEDVKNPFRLRPPPEIAE